MPQSARRKGSPCHPPRLPHSDPRSETASLSCQTLPSVPNVISSAGSVPALESRSLRTQSPLAATRAWEFVEQGNSQTLTQPSLHSQREPAAIPQRVPARRRVSSTECRLTPRSLDQQI